MALRRALLAALVAAVALPASASPLAADPSRFQLDWSERAVSRGKVVMTFRVKVVHFEFQAWSAEVTFVNRSRQTVTVKPQFALLLSRTKQGERYEALVARRSRPALPKTLRPGQSWTGIIGGVGRPRTGTFVRFNFGYFAGSNLFPDSKGFAWITDHVFQVGEAA